MTFTTDLWVPSREFPRQKLPTWLWSYNQEIQTAYRQSQPCVHVKHALTPDAAGQNMAFEINGCTNLGCHPQNEDEMEGTFSR